MKKIIITLFTLIPILINAQTFWSVVVDDNNISHVTDKGLFQDSIILVSGFVNDASCHYRNLFAYNTNGQRLWNIEGYYDLIVTDSSYIYTVGYTTTTDDVSGYEQIVISKYDRNGNEIFSIGYPDIPHNGFYFEFEPKNIELIADGTILISSNSSIIKSNINGTKVQEYELVLESQINGIHAITPTSYLINTQNKIYKSDSSLILLDSIEFSKTINKLLIKNDTVFTLFDSCLVRIDTSLNIIDTIITSSIDLNNMELYDNDLWIQYFQSDSIRLVNLENPDTLVFPILVNSVKFIVSDSSYTFVGNSFTNQIGIYNFQTDNAEISDVQLPDIEIVDFNIDSVVIDYVQLQGDSFATGYRFNTELTIKNNGNDTITTFAVFSDLHGGMNCAQNYFYQKFSNFEILPGQTQIVNLNRAYEDGVNNNQLCFQCLAPNSKLEILTGNNSLCKTFTIIGVENETQSKIKIYPNPITNYLIIELPDLNVKTIDIININGKVLISKVTSGQRLKIETTNLKSGLYIVKITSGDKINTQLIVKE